MKGNKSYIPLFDNVRLSIPARKFFFLCLFPQEVMRQGQDTFYPEAEKGTLDVLPKDMSKEWIPGVART